MKRTKRKKAYVESSDSEDFTPKRTLIKKTSESSSESDIENYLCKPEKLDLDSDFFRQSSSKNENSFGASKKIDSDSESDYEIANDPKENTNKIYLQGTSKIDISYLTDYTKKIEEAKKSVEIYELKKNVGENKTNILNLLATGEKKSFDSSDSHPNDFESNNDWKDIEEGEEEPREGLLVPQKDLQITVDMPDHVRKKKGTDLLSALKRRLNRIRKENQVLVHKVHLLCWIAHGNFINTSINDTEILAMALSILPSEICYPSDRIDLSNLEQIVSWFKQTVKLVEEDTLNDKTLHDSLNYQILNKKAVNQKMLVFIFVAILRALGTQCRIVMSFLVEPLRPPPEELHRVSTKSKEEDDKDINERNNINEKTHIKKKSSPKKQSKQTPTKNADNEISILASIEGGTSKVKSIVQTSKGGQKNLYSDKIEEKKTDSNTFKRNKISFQTQKSLEKEVEKPKTRNQARNEQKQKSANVRVMRNSGTNKTSKGGQKNVYSDKIEEKNSDPKSFKRNKIGMKTKQSPEKEVKKTKTRNQGRNEHKQKSENVRVTRNSEKNKLSSKKSNKTISQVDGVYECCNDQDINILQVDGPSTRKINKSYKISNVKLPIVSSESDSESENEPSYIRRSTRVRAKNSVERSKSDAQKELMVLLENNIDQGNSPKKIRTFKKTKMSDESDEDFVPKKKILKKELSGNRVLSENEHELEKKKKIKKGNDVWLEVFLEAEEKWISVDVIHGQINCVKGIYQRATHPVSYVVSWDNNSKVKDVTQRYCPNFHTLTRKLRVDSSWWNESLKPFIGTPNPRDRREDELLLQQQYDQPLPKAVSEYKNHPLYALKRHLLKFEALYPPEPPTLGFIRGEAVYPRNCVYTLYSRDMWFKQAKVVKLGEQPYNIVKARPIFDKLSLKIVSGGNLDIFGPWQVQDYEPPTAENGMVPRNAFGTVDLFKPCMLPKGCVHLRLPGLNKIARKLNIDIASAFIGFDYVCGGFRRPNYDGFVVCKEYEDQLICAWELEQEEQEKKEEEKINKRVYGNWRKLIKGLLIRERLKQKYDF